MDFVIEMEENIREKGENVGDLYFLCLRINRLGAYSFCYARESIDQGHIVFNLAVCPSVSKKH